MKYLYTLTICLFAMAVFAQQKQNQYLLIIRSKAPVKASQEAIKSNIDHWTAWMTDLGRNGKIIGGYRPANDGVVLRGSDQSSKTTPYTANGEVVSSFLIINAAHLDDAKQITSKYPVFELKRSVEIRAIQNTVN